MTHDFQKGKYRFVICVDVGGVITKPAQRGIEDTDMLSVDYLKTPTIENAIPALAVLNHIPGVIVWIVSRAGAIVQYKTRMWMKHNRFHELTNIPPERVIFCFSREDKAMACNELSATIMIDDRYEVLRHIQGPTRRILFNGHLNDENIVRMKPGFAHIASSWEEVFLFLCGYGELRPYLVASKQP